MGPALGVGCSLESASHAVHHVPASSQAPQSQVGVLCAVPHLPSNCLQPDRPVLTELVTFGLSSFSSLVLCSLDITKIFNVWCIEYNTFFHLVMSVFLPLQSCPCHCLFLRLIFSLFSFTCTQLHTHTSSSTVKWC